MRKTFHNGDMNKSRRTQDKLLYMQSRFEELAAENQGLKEEIVAYRRKTEAIIDSFISDIYDSGIELKGNRILDDPVAELSRLLTYLTRLGLTINRTLIEKEAEISLLNRQKTKLKGKIDALEDDSQKQRQKLSKIIQESQESLQTTTRKLQSEINRLFSLSQRLQKEVNEAGIIRAQLLKQLDDVESKREKQNKKLSQELDQLKRMFQSRLREEERRRREEVESVRRETVNKYTHILQSKKQQNQELLRIIAKEVDPNQSPLVQSLKLIETNQRLMDQMDRMKEKQALIQNQNTELKNKYDEISRQLLEMTASNQSNLENNQRLKIHVELLEKEIVEKDQKLASIRLQIIAQNKKHEEQYKKIIRKSEMQIDKAHMNNRIRIDEQIKSTKSQLEATYSGKIVRMECEVMTLKDSVEAKDNQLTEAKGQNVRLLIKMDEMKYEMENRQDAFNNKINLMKKQIEQCLKNIADLEGRLQEKDKKIKQLLQIIDNLNNLLKKQKQLRNQDKIKHQNEKELIVQAHKKQMVQKHLAYQREKQEAMRQQKQQLIEFYSQMIDEVKQNHQTEMENLRLSRQLMIQNLNEEILQARAKHQQTIEKLKSQERQMRWQLENRLRQERITFKQAIDKADVDLCGMRIDLGRQSRLAEERMKKIQDMNLTIDDNRKQKLALNTEIDSLKEKMSQLNHILSEKSETIKENIERIGLLEKNLDWQKQRYSSVKSNIEEAKDDVRRDMLQLQSKHDKIVLFYKNKVRDLQQYIVSKKNEMEYLDEIEQLKKDNTQLDNNLVKCEAQLITVKQVKKYQDMELENLKEKVKITDSFRNTNSTARKTSGFQRVRTEPNDQDFRTSANLIRRHYQKYTARNRKEKIMEMNPNGKDILGYSLINSMRHRYMSVAGHEHRDTTDRKK